MTGPEAQLNPYAMLWTDTKTGEFSLCEVEAHIVYDVGTREMMEASATMENLRATKAGWPSRYRPVPLPYVGPLPSFQRKRP